MTYGCGAIRGVKVPQFSDFCQFSQYKTNVPSGDQSTAQGLHRRILQIFPCGRRRSKGVPSSSAVFLRLLVVELGTLNLPKFSPMSNDYIHTECHRSPHGSSDLDQRCPKTRNSKDGCTSPPSIFAPTPKTPFWGTFQFETYYTDRSP